MVPQKPPLSLTVTWALPEDPRSPTAPDTPFTRAFLEFLDGDDATRSNIFKLIPRCEDMVSVASVMCCIICVYMEEVVTRFARLVSAMEGIAVAVIW